MGDIVEISDDEDYGAPQIIPKDEGLDLDPRHEMDNVASSSGISLRASFIAMGFPPSHVDKAIADNGEGDAELLLETLSAYSDLQQPKKECFDDGANDDLAADLLAREGHHNSESSDSLDSLFGEDAVRNANGEVDFHLKEEPDVDSGVADNKMTSLLKMNFSSDEVGFALDRLGNDASLDQLMDYIFAARMAKKYEKDAKFPISGDEETKKDFDNEAYFCIMDKTLRLLEMGFSEQEISAAFEKCGSEVPLTELAESIVAPELGGTSSNIHKYSSTSCSSSAQINGRLLNRAQSLDSLTVKTEYGSDTIPQVGISELLEKLKGKRPKVEYTDENNWRKRGRACKEGSSSRTWLDARRGHSSSPSSQVPSSQRRVGRPSILQEDIKPTISISNPCKSYTRAGYKPPYYLYGNVTRLSLGSWTKISQHLNAIQPEFINTQLYSALSRNEGYVHNLPTEDRFNVTPKGPMTIKEALPHTRKWWPSWDTRKQLNHVTSETSGVSYQCDKLGRVLAESRGHPSIEQQSHVLKQCEALNLVWVGNYKLAQIEPEHVELIMGYPLHHTRVSGFSPSDRLKLLELSFQTDTLAYHLSVLKRQFLSPGGLTVFSIFSGIGGAEIALHRLGMRFKTLVSVEPCEKKQKILKKWWENTGQSGQLIQLESTDKVSGDKLEDLIKKLGGVDLVLCQNPYTGADSDSLSGLNFSLFVEFTRVLQRIRITLEKIR